MAANTLVTGIFQADLIIRSAVVTALKEIRDNPTLIDDALASLPQDDLTAGRYGDTTIERCKEWFLGTKVDVRFGLALVQAKFPQISIEIADDDEAEATLGDVNYEPSEPDPNSTTGESRTLASLEVKQSYNLVIAVEGEPELMLFLWTLTLFGLLRNKERLLDARGLDRLSWGVSPAVYSPIDRQNIFMRTIRLRGYARYTWPAADTADGTLPDGSHPRGLIQDVPVAVKPTQASVSVPFESTTEGWGV